MSSRVSAGKNKISDWSHTAFVWPSPPAEMIRNFHGTGVTVFKEIFGALSQDPASPYSRISVANSSFSLDPFVGCPGRCAYCLVGSSARDLACGKEGPLTINSIPSLPERLFAGRELVAALVKHPGFLSNKSVISICTASSEAFLPQVEAETWAIMHDLVQRGLRNPIWIVTKMGIHDSLLAKWMQRFEFLLQHGIRIVLSVCYSAAPSWMEPYRGDRFRNMEKLRRCGVRISHHLRPVVPGINNGREHVKRALEESKLSADAICVGGLRPDPGIRLMWEHIHGLDPGLVPKGPHKQLPEGFLDLVLEVAHEQDIRVPVVKRSSDAISILLGLPEYNLYRYRPEDSNVFLSVPQHIQHVLLRKRKETIAHLVIEHARSIGLDDVEVDVQDNNVRLKKKLTYQEHRLLIHSLGHSGVLT
jgi:DNA repair photolyase